MRKLRILALAVAGLMVFAAVALAVQENTYTVKGIVSLKDTSGGKQSIRIDWQVIDPSGKKVGTVTQQNTIPKGSLNGPWGAIAEAAAGAAADGIVASGSRDCLGADPPERGRLRSRRRRDDVQQARQTVGG